MDVILETDHSLCVAKFFWFYYRNTHIMSIENVHETVLYLFDFFFFKLFFHWSWHVRNMYYHFLLFTIHFRFKNKNFNEDKKQFSRQRLEKLKERDEKGIVNTLNTNYPEQLKAKILARYYEQMMVIEKIRGIIRKEKLNQDKDIFNTAEPNVTKHIINEVKPYILISIHHFQNVENFFKQWEKDAKANKDSIKYPDITLQQPKDDYVEYNENW